MFAVRVICMTVLFCSGLLAGSADLGRARKLYDRIDYAGALKILQSQTLKDGPAWELIGQSYFMMAEYKKAAGAFEQAVAADPSSSEFVLWLGRAWGRRAEVSNALVAGSYASKARQCFERAVALDGTNKEALSDLFDYYLEAPGFLGGGFGKAEDVANRMARLDAAEGYFAKAQLSDRRKHFDEAEAQLRRAVELTPRQVGRLLDLAAYLSKRGRAQESDLAFARAQKLAPNSPDVLYRTAETYVRDGRNLEKARDLLRRYLGSELTPEDPSREKAQVLLRKADGA